MQSFPFFFNPPSIMNLHRPADMSDTILRLRKITTKVDAWSKLGRFGTPTTPADGFNELWDSGNTSQLLLSVVNAHIDSCADPPGTFDGHETDVPMSRWSGFCVAMGLYLTCILGVWNRGQPPEPRLFLHILDVLQRDLTTTKDKVVEAGAKSTHLWLWKCFVASAALAQTCTPTSSIRFQKLQGFFKGGVFWWIRETGTREWEEARQVLGNIVWPEISGREDLCRALWKRCAET